MLLFLVTLLFVPTELSAYCSDKTRFLIGFEQCDELVESLGDDIEDLNTLCADRDINKACRWSCHSCRMRPVKLKRTSLVYQNIIRENHHASKLNWNVGLENSATQQCRKLAGLEWIEGQISPNAGKNTFHGVNIRQYVRIALYAARQWYQEEKLYNYNKHVYQAETAKFTRMVWKAVTDVGCGFAKSQEFSKAKGVTNHVYYCCHYLPAGNFLNQFENNVGEPIVMF